MKRVKVRYDTGCVCTQYVYNVPESSDIRRVGPKKPRFKNEEERKLHAWKVARRDHFRKFMENFCPGDLFATLTFDEAHKVYDFDKARRVRDNYFRRLVRACPGAVIFMYMGRGRTTDRIHLHMVCKGIPEEIIRGKWKEGTVDRIEGLRKYNYYDMPDGSRKNCGADFTGLANYLFGHWKEEQGGHRYKCTRNARKPKPESIKEVKRDYHANKPPRAPKGYELVEVKGNQYGYWMFRYIKIPEMEPVGMPWMKERLIS